MDDDFGDDSGRNRGLGPIAAAERAKGRGEAIVAEELKRALLDVRRASFVCFPLLALLSAAVAETRPAESLREGLSIAGPECLPEEGYYWMCDEMEDRWGNIVDDIDPDWIEAAVIEAKKAREAKEQLSQHASLWDCD